MPSIALHPRSSAPVDDPSHPVHNPLPQLLQTPSGLALLELQGTINVPTSEAEHDDPSDENGIAQSTSYETPIGKLMFPDYSIHNPDDTKWMKRVYLYVGRYQRMTGEVKKLPKPIAVLQKRAGTETEELEVVEIVRAYSKGQNGDYHLEDMSGWNQGLRELFPTGVGADLWDASSRDYNQVMGNVVPIGPRGRNYGQIQRCQGHETKDLQCCSVVPRVAPPCESATDYDLLRRPRMPVGTTKG
ncbi:hypothetical protein PoHVEF18_006000 [Penicillium ochrochloron]